MASLLAGLANPINALLAALTILTGGYVVGWSRLENGPTLGAMGVGWITNFLDQLGIGSFAKRPIQPTIHVFLRISISSVHTSILFSFATSQRAVGEREIPVP